VDHFVSLVALIIFFGEEVSDRYSTLKIKKIKKKIKKNIKKFASKIPQLKAILLSHISNSIIL
jgi:hypothetical protein